MNDKQFDALLAVLKDIAEEMMFLRDELTGFRDIYGQAHGFESDSEHMNRMMDAFEDECQKIKNKDLEK